MQTQGSEGSAEPGFEPVAERLGTFVAADPTRAGTLCVHHHGARVPDPWWARRVFSLGVAVFTGGSLA